MKKSEQLYLLSEISKLKELIEETSPDEIIDLSSLQSRLKNVQRELDLLQGSMPTPKVS